MWTANENARKHSVLTCGQCELGAQHVRDRENYTRFAFGPTHVWNSVPIMWHFLFFRDGSCGFWWLVMSACGCACLARCHVSLCLGGRQPVIVTHTSKESAYINRTCLVRTILYSRGRISSYCSSCMIWRPHAVIFQLTLFTLVPSRSWVFISRSASSIILFPYPRQ